MHGSWYIATYLQASPQTHCTIAGWLVEDNEVFCDPFNQEEDIAR